MSKPIYEVGDVVLFYGHRCNVVWIDEPNGTPNERMYTLRIAHRWNAEPNTPPIEYFLSETRVRLDVKPFKSDRIGE